MTELADVLELLFSSPSSWKTLRATIRHGAGPDSRDDDSEVRIWLASGGRRRVEDEVEADGELGARVLVVDGSNWWARLPGEEGVTVGDHERPPSVVATSALEAFLGGLGWFDLEVVGQRSQLGRSCLVLRAVPRPLVAWLSTRPPLPGDEQEAWVDEERGVVLRLESRASGRPIAVSEFTELSFDEELAEDIFGEAPSGAEVRTEAERRAAFFVSLDDAVARAPFTVLVPASLPEDACLQRVWLGRRANASHTTVGVTYDLHHARHLSIEEAGTATAFASTADWERLDLDGAVVFLHEPTEPGTHSYRQAWVQREGTTAVVSLSVAVGRQPLLDIASSLGPVGDTKEGDRR